MTNHCNC